MGIGVGKCVGMWESVWSERGEVCWSVGVGNRRCGGKVRGDVGV